MCWCFEKIVKYVLFLVNILTVIASVALIVLGAIILKTVDFGDKLKIDFDFSIIPISVIVLGVIIFVISFSGCCGAVKEVRCLLIMYSIFMLILASVKTYIAVVLFKALKTLDLAIKRWVEEMFNQYVTDGTFFALERVFKCCGVDGKTSYVQLGWPVLPGTCCPNESSLTISNISEGSNSTCPIDAETYDGCGTVISDTLIYYGHFVGIVVVGLIVVEVVAMIFSLFLTYRIARNNRQKSMTY